MWRRQGNRLTWRLKEHEVQAHLRRLARVVVHFTSPTVFKADLVHAYLDKDKVKKVWRLGKGGLGLVDVKHYKRDRVVAYPFVCYLAYLLYALVRHRLHAQGFDLSVDKALNHSHRVMVVLPAPQREGPAGPIQNEGDQPRGRPLTPDYNSTPKQLPPVKTPMQLRSPSL